MQHHPTLLEATCWEMLDSVGSTNVQTKPTPCDMLDRYQDPSISMWSLGSGNENRNITQSFLICLQLQKHGVFSVVEKTKICCSRSFNWFNGRRWRAETKERQDKSMDKEERRERLFKQHCSRTNVGRHGRIIYGEMMRMSYNDFSQILSAIESVITPHQVMGGHKVIKTRKTITKQNWKIILL